MFTPILFVKARHSGNAGKGQRSCGKKNVYEDFGKETRKTH
jgi:hypothetical protein